MSADKIEPVIEENEPCPDSLLFILSNKLYLRKFRKFLRGHLALENLLFYERVTLYKRLNDSGKREKAAKFLINQFISETGEDPINLPGSLRLVLQQTRNFVSDTFDEARNAIFHLMEDNYLTFFWEYLKGKRGVTISLEELKSKLAPEKYFLNLSFDNISERLDEDQNGDLVFISCSCHPSRNGSSTLNIACCEKGRIRKKLMREDAEIFTMKSTGTAKQESSSDDLKLRTRNVRKKNRRRSSVRRIGNVNSGLLKSFTSFTKLVSKKSVQKKRMCSRASGMSFWNDL